MLKTCCMLLLPYKLLIPVILIGLFCNSVSGKNYLNERKIMDQANGVEYVPTYEDKDGDWMMVGDVPWE